MTDRYATPHSHHGGRSPSHPRRHGAHHPMIRWEALATGSLVGIAAWALAYVLGAASLLTLGLDPGAMALTGRIGLGLYGAVSASWALAFAAYTAARTGGARTAEQALFYGLCLWSLSTLTLVTVTTLAGLGLFTQAMVRAVPIFAVGLAAVGALPQTQELASASTFGAILATLLVSLVLALWGGAQAYRGRVTADAP